MKLKSMNLAEKKPLKTYRVALRVVVEYDGYLFPEVKQIRELGVSSPPSSITGRGHSQLRMSRLIIIG